MPTRSHLQYFASRRRHGGCHGMVTLNSSTGTMNETPLPAIWLAFRPSLRWHWLHLHFPRSQDPIVATSSTRPLGRYTSGASITVNNQHLQISPDLSRTFMTNSGRPNCRSPRTRREKVRTLKKVMAEQIMRAVEEWMTQENADFREGEALIGRWRIWPWR